MSVTPTCLTYLKYSVEYLNIPIYAVYRYTANGLIMINVLFSIGQITVAEIEHASNILWECLASYIYCINAGLSPYAVKVELVSNKNQTYFIPASTDTPHKLINILWTAQI